MSHQQMNDERILEYSKEALRSGFVSLFWAVITEKRRTGTFTLQSIADALNIDKSAVSRWFSAEHPNWQSDTIAQIAHVLGLRIDISATEVSSGKIYSPTGLVFDPGKMTVTYANEVKTGTNEPNSAKVSIQVKKNSSVGKVELV